MLQIGRFLGEVDSMLLQALVEKEVYKRIEMYDYQAVCNIYAAKFSSATSFVLNVSRNYFFFNSWIKTLLFSMKWCRYRTSCNIRMKYKYQFKYNFFIYFIYFFFG